MSTRISTLSIHVACSQAFDHDTGRPKRYVEMLSWPRAHRLHRALPTVLAGVFWESFVPTKAAATMRMVFNRCATTQPSKHCCNV